MTPDDFIIAGSEPDYVRPLLACGHWGHEMFDCSSQWDFPHEALICPECNDERQMDVRLQAALMEEFMGPALPT